MVDSGAVGGLAPLGDRYGGSPPPQERAPTQPHEAQVGPGQDTAVVAVGVAAAFALLREPVLAATRRRTLSPPQVGTVFGAGMAPGYALGVAAVRSLAADPGAAAAVVAIENEQRWHAAGHPELDVHAQRGAFDDGLDETEAILRDVARGDAEVWPWLAAVRAVHAARLQP